MKFDCLLTGVGGEGVLTSQVIIARAANLEGYFVRGMQLHGLAQRGGSIPTMVRFGSVVRQFDTLTAVQAHHGGEISSPSIMQANADLILAFEPLEAVRAIYYARKEKTIFVLDDYPYIPIYSHLLKVPYPTIEEVRSKITPFAKEIHVFSAHKIAKKEFADLIFGNTILVGAAYGLGALPLKKESLAEAIEISAPRELEKNLAAFEYGLKLGQTSMVNHN